jgi:hypothetical protein
MRSDEENSKPSPHPPGLDLEASSETTRRALYDAVVAVHFTAPAELRPGDWYPDYSPDQAGLVVFRTHGRWLAGWSMLEEANNSDLPESRRYELVTIQANPEAPHGVTFQIRGADRCKRVRQHASSLGRARTLEIEKGDRAGLAGTSPEGWRPPPPAPAARQ